MDRRMKAEPEPNLGNILSWIRELKRRSEELLDWQSDHDMRDLRQGLHPTYDKLVSELKAASASSVASTGPAMKPSESFADQFLAARTENQVDDGTPSAPTGSQLADFRFIIKPIVSECDEWWQDYAENINRSMMRSTIANFCSYLSSTLERHLTSGSTRAGDPGVADPVDESIAEATVWELQALGVRVERLENVMAADQGREDDAARERIARGERP